MMIVSNARTCLLFVPNIPGGLMMFFRLGIIAVTAFVGLSDQRSSYADASTAVPFRRQIYMVNNPVISPEQVIVANRDGSDAQVIAQAGDGVSDIEVFEDHIYWTENYTFSVKRASLDGSNIETIFQGPNTFPTPFPASLTIDSTARRVYWTSQMVGGIRSANLDGSDARMFNAANIREPYAIDVDPVGGHVYWTEYFRKQIWRSGLDGSNSTLLVQDAGGSPTLFGLALDPVDRKMYWTNSELKVIRRADYDGSGVQTIVSGSVLSKYTDIEIDPISRQLLWIDDRKGTEDRSYILQSNLDGTGRQTLTSVFGQMTGIAVSVPEPSAAAMAVWLTAFYPVSRLRRQRYADSFSRRD